MVFLEYELYNLPSEIQSFDSKFIIQRYNYHAYCSIFSEQIKTNDRELRKVDRDVERDRNKLEREEKKLELEIKKAAKTGNKQATTVLAKQLIQMRKQKTRTFTVQSQIRGAKNQAHAMGANAKLAETMYVLITCFHKS